MPKKIIKKEAKTQAKTKAKTEAKTEPIKNVTKTIKSIADIKKPDINDIRNNTEMLINEIEHAAIEHMKLAIKQVIDIQDNFNKNSKEMLRKYAPDFIHPYIEQIDTFMKPYTGVNLQRTFTTQYESAYSWVKSVAPKQTHQFIERLDRWMTPLKYQ